MDNNEVLMQSKNKSKIAGSNITDNTLTLELILNISKKLNGTLVLDDVLEEIVKTAIQITNADRGFIVLNDRNGQLNFRMCLNAEGEQLPSSIFKICTSVVQDVFNSCQSSFIDDSTGSESDCADACISSLQLKTILCSPIIIEKNKIGVIYVDSKSDRKIITEEITKAFEILAGFAAISINNAQQYYKQTKANFYLEKINKELKTAKENAGSSEKLKTEFLAQISHEIRTPVNTIMNFAELIKEEEKNNISSSSMDNFKTISSACYRLIRTIDLVINMSEIQTGSFDLKPKQFDLFNQVLIPLHDEYLKTTEEKDLEFNIISETEDTKVIGDEYCTNQIFSNLIMNAIKFTESGGVKIIMKRDDLDRLVVSVDDTGVGISEDYFADLYKPFTQEEQGYSRKYEGNGLGLSLVKEYCKLNSAELKVKSIKGEGSSFSVIFNNVQDSEHLKEYYKKKLKKYARD